jgi:adenosylhomocysteine nucleosidase
MYNKGVDTGMLIGIIGAMARETDAIMARMANARMETVCGIRCCRGMLDGLPAVVAQCGIGKVFAALCAAVMIERYHPDLL